MKNHQISERVLKKFRDNGNAPLSYNELVQELKLVKKEKSLLSETLQALMAEGVIAKKSRKYRLTAESLEAGTQTQNDNKNNPRLIEGKFDATPMAKNQSYAFVRTEKGDFFVSSEDTLNAYH
ncbi:MAG: hypothetical protein ACP5F3_04905, partial [Candidatus Syntrophosphaera sp.]